MTHGPAPRRRACSATHEEQDDEGGGSSVEQPPPPDGGWGWVVVFASFSIHIVTDGVTYSFGVFYNEFLKYFSEGAAATAWIASILVGVTLCSGPISSSFVNKYGCRAVTIAGSILAALCMGLSVFAPNVLTLYFTIGIGTGFGFGLIYLPAIVSVTCYFEKYRSLATGIAVCGSGLGTFVFAPLTDHLIVEYGWRGALAIIAAIVLNCIILGALFRPVEEYQKPVRQRPKQSDDDESLMPKEYDPLNTKTNILSDGTSSNLHRPRSIGHLTVPRSMKVKPHLTTSSSDVARLALSQPVLSSPEQRITFGSHQALRKSSGIMYRRDIFYRGSLHNIPYHRSNPWLSTIDQKQHVNDDNVQNGDTRHQTTSFSDSISTDTNDTKVLGCIPCSKETADTLREMLDFSLLLDPIFILFTISNFFTSIGFNMPYVYIVAQAEQRGIESYDASYLLSIIGMSNLVGRVILGYLSDKTWVNRLLVYNLCLTICGVATGLSALCHSYTSFCVYASVFGFTIGAYVGLTSVILVDLLGLDRLTNAFGLLLLFQGIASLVGPPIGGWLYDVLNTYNPAFYVAGFAIAISGLMLFAIPSLQRYLARRKRPREKLGPPTNGAVTQSISV